MTTTYLLHEHVVRCLAKTYKTTRQIRLEVCESTGQTVPFFDIQTVLHRLHVANKVQRAKRTNGYKWRLTR